ncbi:nucleotidyltransferase domain-containing protein [Deltaproteobacteria bacterium OttesenSCG-928-K17]|nr:nucleotidyltransferase domain-containing protein [Deltaproteobacteria bacterium OttesenSCG-928-K17]
MNQSLDKTALLRRVDDLCRQRGVRLLYLTLFGSALYGTDRPDRSDVDLRGVFIAGETAPPQFSGGLNISAGNGLDSPLAAAGVGRRSIHEATGSAACRNRPDDIDIDLWSLPHWLNLLAEGNIGALDLIFSPSNEAAVIYRHPLLDAVFNKPLRLLNTAESRPWLQYSLGQAKKYGIKGSRLGAVRAAARGLKKTEIMLGERLEPYLEQLVESCDDENFCCLTTSGGLPAVKLGGKIFVGRMKLAEFARRIELEMKQHGSRAIEAEANRGLDFKALSHAVRALDQMAELYESGRVVFPLRSRAELMAIKEGRFTWAELEPMILSRLGQVEGLRRQSAFIGRHDAAFARQCLLACLEQAPSTDKVIV